MAWFSKVAIIRPEIKLVSVLRMCDSSLKLLRTTPFSPLRFIQNNHHHQLSQKLRVIPSIRKQSNILSHSHVLQRDSYKSFFHKGKQWTCFVRLFHTNQINAAKLSTNVRGSPKNNTTALIYVVAIFIFMLGGAYAGVPLYKVFCQATGLGGQAVREENSAKIESMQKVDRQIRVLFNADVASSMRWNFKPQQNEVTVLPGETALAFYTAKNPTDKPIIGISTYNVLPFDAGQYFNKIQCFCFEEQRLNPKEQVDMPVFFYIDPEFAEDPKLEHVDTITLSYTFFEAVDGLTLPLPGYPQPHDPLPPPTTTRAAVQ